MNHFISIMFNQSKLLNNMKKIIRSKNRLLTDIALLLIVSGFLVSCTKKSDIPGLNEVFIYDGSFDPVTLTVSANTTVTWTNKGGMAHTVTGTGFDSGSISPNGTWSHLFTTVGPYPYYCTFHANMTANVNVN
jgi:plastocyanin